MPFPLFLCHSVFFSFSVHSLASHPALGKSINRKRKQRSENEAKKRENCMNCRTQTLSNLELVNSPQIYENVVCNMFVCPCFPRKKETFSFLIAFANCDVPQSVAAALIKVNPEPAIFSFYLFSLSGLAIAPMGPGWNADVEAAKTNQTSNIKHNVVSNALIPMHIFHIFTLLYCSSG